MFSNQGWLVYDPLDYDIDWKPIQPNEVSPIERAISMKELYAGAEDLFPHRMPKALGKEVNINCFVDSDHADNRVTR